jgi:hypothetical protein
MVVTTRPSTVRVCQFRHPDMLKLPNKIIRVCTHSVKDLKQKIAML